MTRPPTLALPATPTEEKPPMPETTLIGIARAAYADIEAARQAESERRAQEHREREAAADADALASALRSPLTEWFPGVAWELFDRKLPMSQVALRDPESGLLFMVRPISHGTVTDWHVDLVDASRVRGGNGYRTLADGINGPAAVGRYLANRDREQSAEPAFPNFGDER